MALPLVFPIFPLNEVILVPGQMLPLHIFEPRYREMVADALAGDPYIGMAVTENGHSTDAEDEPLVRPVCGLGRIVHHQGYADGRSDIILEGVARMKIAAEVESEKAYRIVEAREFEDVIPDTDLAERTSALLGRVHGFDDDERRVVAELPLSALLDSILIRIPASIDVKHEIFATQELLERLRALEEAMDRLEEPPSSVCFAPSDPRLN